MPNNYILALKKNLNKFQLFVCLSQVLNGFSRGGDGKPLRCCCGKFKLYSA